jgi:hypothetical protein
VKSASSPHERSDMRGKDQAKSRISLRSSGLRTIHVIASEAKQYPSFLYATTWIASSLRSLAQTLRVCHRQ